MLPHTIEYPKFFTFNYNSLKNVLINGTNALNGAALNGVFTVKLLVRFSVITIVIIVIAIF